MILRPCRCIAEGVFAPIYVTSGDRRTLTLNNLPLVLCDTCGSYLSLSNLVYGMYAMLGEDEYRTTPVTEEHYRKFNKRKRKK